MTILLFTTFGLVLLVLFAFHQVQSVENSLPELSHAEILVPFADRFPGGISTLTACSTVALQFENQRETISTKLCRLLHPDRSALVQPLPSLIDSSRPVPCREVAVSCCGSS